MDQISFLKFGSVLSKAKNLMLLQSVPRPDPVLRDFYTKYNLTEMLLIMNNGSLKKAVDAYLNSSKQSLVKQYKDQSSALESFISILWHTKLPCHDLKGVTSEVEGEASMLKLCKWKGRPVPCNKIFQKVMTDSGICCAFNMKKADQIFVKSRYTDVINQLQEEDQVMAFKSNISAQWYTDNGEPRTQPGTKIIKPFYRFNWQLCKLV